MARSWVTRPGRPRVFDGSSRIRARDLYRAGRSIDDIVQELGISRATFYRYQAAWRTPTLRIGILSHLSPRSRDLDAFPDGDEPIHGEIRLARLLAEQLGARVQLRAASCKDLFRGLDDGRLDFALGMLGASPARRARFALSAPYFETEAPRASLVTPRGVTASIEDPATLVGLRVAVMEESLSWEWLQHHATGARVVPLRHQTSCYRALLAGRVDAVMLSNFYQHPFLEQHPRFELRSPGLPFDRADHCLFVGRDNRRLLEHLDDSLHELRRRHDLDELAERMRRALARRT
jgi:ABC-type amino acid transport substrate-binding protein